jgi:hypothetical protein
MRHPRIGFGLGLFLFAGVSGAALWQCSFYLPERPICSDIGCNSGGADLGTPPDMTKDPNDPTVAGPFLTATFQVPNPPPGLTEQLLLGPSDDGTTVSSKNQSYPVVLIAPAEGMPIASMRGYAERLASHGFFVALYQVTNQQDHSGYRNTGLAYLNAVLSNPDASVKSKMDMAHLGLLGYELGAKVSAGMAVQDSRIGGLFLIDPLEVLASTGAFSGVNAMGQVTLASGGTSVIIGEAFSTMGTQACNPGVKSYVDFYNAAKAPALSISFGGANLGDFVDNYPDPLCTMGSTSPRAQTQGLTLKFATAYFQWTLKGMTKSRDYLFGPSFTNDVAVANLTAKSK